MPHSTRVTNTIRYTPKLPNEHCGRELLSAGAVVVPIASTTVVYKSTDERPVASGWAGVTGVEFVECVVTLGDSRWGPLCL